MIISQNLKTGASKVKGSQTPGLWNEEQNNACYRQLVLKLCFSASCCINIIVIKGCLADPGSVRAHWSSKTTIMSTQNLELNLSKTNRRRVQGWGRTEKVELNSLQVQRCWPKPFYRKQTRMNIYCCGDDLYQQVWVRRRPGITKREETIIMQGGQKEAEKLSYLCCNREKGAFADWSCHGNGWHLVHVCVAVCLCAWLYLCLNVLLSIWRWRWGSDGGSCWRIICVVKGKWERGPALLVCSVDEHSLNTKPRERCWSFTLRHWKHCPQVSRRYACRTDWIWNRKTERGRQRREACENKCLSKCSHGATVARSKAQSNPH